MMPWLFCDLWCWGRVDGVVTVLISIDALVATRSPAAAEHVLRESTGALRVVRAFWRR